MDTGRLSRIKQHLNFLFCQLTFEFLVLRRRHTIYFAESFDKAGGCLVAKFLIDSLYRHIAIMLGIAETSASLTDAELIEIGFEVLAVSIIDYHGNILRIRPYHLSQHCKTEIVPAYHAHVFQHTVYLFKQPGDLLLAQSQIVRIIYA